MAPPTLADPMGGHPDAVLSRLLNLNAARATQDTANTAVPQRPKGPKEKTGGIGHAGRAGVSVARGT